MSTMAIVAFACVVTAIGALANESHTHRERTWVAPAAVDSMQNPLKNRPETGAGGQKLFRQRCSICHADDGTGAKPGPNLMLRRVQQQSDGAFFWKISSGNTRTGMPGFSFLPRLQRWQLVKHLRSLAEPTQPRMLSPAKTKR